MDALFAVQAIQSVINSQYAYCKFLSANDTGATGGHQYGILVSKSASIMLFPQGTASSNILKREIEIFWQDGSSTQSTFTYYRSKNELRITKFGRNFPFLQPENTGTLFVFTQQSPEHYSGFFLETEEEIEQFLEATGISSTETNKLISLSSVNLEAQLQTEIQKYITKLDVYFPTSEEISSVARTIQNKIYNHIEYVQSNPDNKIIEWTKTEYSLFRAIEHLRCGGLVTNGFNSIDEFIVLANTVLNRRKSRAGKSLEHHLAAIFDGNNISYTPQATTEGKKRPDFLFPSQEAYHNPQFPEDKLITLAAKTTCKDRWRQIVTEADRLRDKTKYLCTLQQGISPNQMKEMQQDHVVLVVPKPYINAYPTETRENIWSISKFIAYVKEKER